MLPILNNDSTPSNEKIVSEKENQISKEYKQAISFLEENVVFRKAYKEHFSGGDLKIIRQLKKHFVKGEFQFTLMPTIK